MTVVAAVRLNGNPVVIGDVVISHEGERVGCVNKVYRFGKNLALGWTGPVRGAEIVIARLSEELRRPRISEPELLRVLASIPPQPGLELTGWLIDQGVRHVYWWGEVPGAMLYQSEAIIGDGRDVFRRSLAHRGEGNVTGIHETVCQALLQVGDARIEEMLYADKWFPTWGWAYDIAFYAEDQFMWAPPMTGLAWDCHMSSHGDVLSLVRHPTMFKQQRVHDRLVLQLKHDDKPECMTEVCEPVHERMRDRYVVDTPFSAKSFCYANYVRLHVDGTYIDKISFIIVKPGPDGPLFVEDDPVHGARFSLDADAIGRQFRESFPTAFAGAPTSMPPPTGGAKRPFVAAGGHAQPDEPSTSQASASHHAVGSWNRKLQMDTVVALARENAAFHLAGADALFGDQPYVYVVGDASEPLGETFLVSVTASKDGEFAEARARIRAQVAARQAPDGNLGFGGLLTTADVVRILQGSGGPEQIATVVGLVAELTTPPPTGWTHVLAIAEGDVLATLVACKTEPTAPAPAEPPGDET